MTNKCIHFIKLFPLVHNKNLGVILDSFLFLISNPSGGPFDSNFITDL